MVATTTADSTQRCLSDDAALVSRLTEQPPSPRLAHGEHARLRDSVTDDLEARRGARGLRRRGVLRDEPQLVAAGLQPAALRDAALEADRVAPRVGAIGDLRAGGDQALAALAPSRLPGG